MSLGDCNRWDHEWKQPAWQIYYYTTTGTSTVSNGTYSNAAVDSEPVMIQPVDDQPETALAWLDRRVNEIRVSL